MKSNTSRAELLKQLFATHPNTKIFFLTSDNEAFFEQNDAVNYGKQLEDDSVTPEKRPAKSAEPAPVAPVLNAEDEELKKAEVDALKAEKASVNARFKELFGKNPTGKKFDDIKKIIAEKEAETANAKQY